MSDITTEVIPDILPTWFDASMQRGTLFADVLQKIEALQSQVDRYRFALDVILSKECDPVVMASAAIGEEEESDSEC